MKLSLNLQLIRKHLTPLMNSLTGLDYYFYGGCIRDLYQGKIPNDYDIGCKTLEDLQALIDRLGELGWVLEMETAYGLKFKYLNNIIDVSTDTLSDPTERIKNFDFTINSIAYTSENICIFHISSFNDIDEKKLIPLDGSHDEDEMIADRSIKFWKEGYHSKGNTLPPRVKFSHSSVFAAEIRHMVFDLKK
jgi:tRNA nucleotidyltransferase/poly(A) polymerase